MPLTHRSQLEFHPWKWTRNSLRFFPEGPIAFCTFQNYVCISKKMILIILGQGITSKILASYNIFTFLGSGSKQRIFSPLVNLALDCRRPLTNSVLLAILNSSHRTSVKNFAFKFPLLNFRELIWKIHRVLFLSRSANATPIKHLLLIINVSATDLKAFNNFDN